MLVSPTKCPFPGQGNHSREAVRQYWNDGLRKLIDYKKKHGHCRVPVHDPNLGRWVQKQRGNWKNGKLNPADIHRLLEIGFIPDGHYSRWAVLFDMLVAFKEEFGHTSVPSDSEDVQERYPTLSTWIRQERWLKKAGRLDSDRIKLMESIGFDWEPNATKFDQHFEGLVQYKKQHGHCSVPINSIEYAHLGRWVYYLRKRWRESEGNLDKMPCSREQFGRLIAIGFDFRTPQHDWNGYYKLLKQVYNERGCVNGPVPNKGTFRGLQAWRTFQRAQAKRGRLSRERFLLLDVLGFNWDPEAVRWNDCVRDLEVMTERFGFQTTYLGMEIMDGEPFLSNEVETLPLNRTNHINYSLDMSRRDVRRLVKWYTENRSRVVRGKAPKGWDDSIHGMGYWTSSDIEFD